MGSTRVSGEDDEDGEDGEDDEVSRGGQNGLASGQEESWMVQLGRNWLDRWGQSSKSVPAPGQ